MDEATKGQNGQNGHSKDEVGEEDDEMWWPALTN